MKKVFCLLGGLLIALTTGCAETMPRTVSYSLAQKCKLDKNLRYYLVYDVDTAEQSDKAVLFLTYSDVAKMMKNKICLVERTLKNKPKKAKMSSPPEENENGIRDHTLRF